jgi:putative transposase
MLRDKAGDAIERDRAIDFVHNPLTTGRGLRVLTTVDIFCRFSPALAPRFIFSRHCRRNTGKVCNEVRFWATNRVAQSSGFLSPNLEFWANWPIRFEPERF